MTDLAEKLLQVRYVVGAEPHIRVDPVKCSTCDERICLCICPSSCFTLQAERIRFAYEGCLECGTCRILCSRQALTWSYPLGGYGVSFRFG